MFKAFGRQPYPQWPTFISFLSQMSCWWSCTRDQQREHGGVGIWTLMNGSPTSHPLFHNKKIVLDQLVPVHYFDQHCKSVYISRCFTVSITSLISVCLVQKYHSYYHRHQHQTWQTILYRKINFELVVDVSEKEYLGYRFHHKHD